MNSVVLESERLSPRRLRRRDSLIASAIEIINRDGIGGLDFPALTKAAGCGRAILYHYFANRGDLIYHCYRASCEREEALLGAAMAKDSGIAALAHYVEGSLATPPASTVVVSETSMLDAQQQRDIETRLRAIYGRIEHILEAGQRDGSFRSCRGPILARVIHSMIAFAILARRWADAGQLVEAGELVDLFIRGSASRADFVFAFHDSVDAFSRVKLENFDKQDLADLRIEQILMAASRMFNQRGIANVSLDELAVELGVTRGAIYHYFEDRQDLLVRCLERGMALYNAFVDHAIERGRSGFEKSLIVGHLNAQAQAGSLQPIMPWIGIESLPAELQPTYFTKMRTLLDRTAALQAEGVLDGSRREGQSSTVVARGGAYNSVPKWIGQVGNPPPRLIADEIVDMFVRGIGAPARS